MFLLWDVVFRSRYPSHALSVLPRPFSPSRALLLSFPPAPVLPAPPCHARPLCPSRIPPLSFPHPPSVIPASPLCYSRIPPPVIPAVFSGNPQVVSLPTAEQAKLLDSRLTMSGMTEREPCVFILVAGCRLQVALSFPCPLGPSHAPSVPPAASSCPSRPPLFFPPLPVMPAPSVPPAFPILSLPHSPSCHSRIPSPVIPAVFSGNPQVGSLPTAEQAKLLDSRLTMSGMTEREPCLFILVAGCRLQVALSFPRPLCPSHAPSVLPKPLQSFPRPPPVPPGFPLCPSRIPPLSFPRTPPIPPAFPILSFPQFLAGIHRWDRCRRRNKQNGWIPD